MRIVELRADEECQVSYAVMAYAVDFGELRSLIGSGDEELARRYGEGFAASWPDVEAMLAEGSDDGWPTAREVAEHMIMGEPYTESAGFAYGYFLEYLCAERGEALDNSGWDLIDSGFIYDLGATLREAGLHAAVLSLPDLAFGAPPVPLPDIDDFPGIGYLDHADLTACGDVLSVIVPRLTGDHRRAADSLVRWLTLTEAKLASLVCFYH